MRRFNLRSAAADLLLPILIGAALALTSCAREEEKSCSEPQVEPGTEKIVAGDFNQALATELGADEYGMKRYVMAFLKKGPNQDQSPEEAKRLQRAHMDNISKLAEQHKLVVAGPFMDDTELRGIYIFDVETIEEAKALTQTDPAIKAGRLVMELHPWYGSAALIKSAEIHKTVAKKEI
ncbi:YciI-like protein [compost metagenome]